MQINQNFSIPAGDDAVVAFDVDESLNLATLVGYELFWMAYKQQYGCPIPGEPAVIEKTNRGGSDDITIPESPALRFYVNLYQYDSVNLLRNYYHEACFFDSNSQKVTVACGIMTVLATENRPTP